MLKVDFDADKGRRMLQVSGTIGEITAELGIVINGIYQSIRGNDPKMAAAFERAMQNITSNDSSVWKNALRGEGVCVVMPK